MRIEDLKGYNLPVPILFKIKEVHGEVGLELETIGKSLPQNDWSVGSNFWSAKSDSSIKPRQGEMGIEYVLKQPVGRIKVRAALEELHKGFKDCKSTVAHDRLSNSTHVHLNVQDLTMLQVLNILTTYYIFEELLVRWAGPDREANLFCLRSRDAYGIIRFLRKAIQDDSYQTLNTKTIRYAAANVAAIPKFGSLEFRALRGTPEIDVVSAWVETLLAIKDYAVKAVNPIAIIDEFKLRSPLGFASLIIPANMCRWMFTQTDFTDRMWKGFNLAQDLAFSKSKWEVQKFDWDAWKKNQKEPRAKVKGGSMFVQDSSYLSSWTDSLDNAMNALNEVATNSAHPSLTAIYHGYIGTSGAISSTPNQYTPPGTTLKNYRLKENKIPWMVQHNFHLEWKNSQGTLYLAITNSNGGVHDWARTGLTVYNSIMEEV